MRQSGSCSDGRATLSKSLIQFSIDAWDYVPSLYFGMTVGVLAVMVTSFKRTYARTVVFSAPNPMSGHCRPTPPPETPEHSQASLAQYLVGSLFLSPGSWYAQGFVCTLQESLFP